MGVVTVGVDLAAESTNTAVARLEWVPGGVEVLSIDTPATDDEIIDRADDDTVGIDCPFGWPTEFVDFLAAHHAGRPLHRAASTKAERKPLVYRATDRFVQAEPYSMRPLSVSADRIGHAAFRCAGLLAVLDPSGDRSGAGRCVETYPAGSLRMWRLPYRGYKGPDRVDTLRAIGGELRDRLPMTFHGDTERDFERNDHAFDAVIAAITARAQQRRLVVDIPQDCLAIARIEGWIAIPKPDSLGSALFA